MEETILRESDLANMSIEELADLEIKLIEMQNEIEGLIEECKLD